MKRMEGVRDSVTDDPEDDSKTFVETWTAGTLLSPGVSFTDVPLHREPSDSSPLHEPRSPSPRKSPPFASLHSVRPSPS